MARGKAQRGEKTMLDALGPGIDVLKEAAVQRRRFHRCGAPLGRGCRSRYEGDYPNAGDQGPRILPGRAQHWPPGSRCHIRLLYRSGAVRNNREHPEQLQIADCRLYIDAYRNVQSRINDEEVTTMAKYAAAIDQGTTSTRFMIFDHAGKVVCYDQKEHEQIFPKPGWVEHSPDEIWERTQSVIKGALAKGNIDPKDIAAVGITNQRETTVVWDSKTGKPLYNAIVWQDTRTDQIIVTTGRERRRTRIASVLRSACRSRPISRARRSSGFSIMSMARGRRAERGDCNLRQHRHMCDLEPDRRDERRRACHRRHQRQPHAC